MKQWETILHYASLLFVVSSLAGELILPASVRFLLDDLFFPFGVLFLVKTFFKDVNWRWLIVAFGMMAAWGMLSDVLANGGLRTAPIGMLVRWLKWPIILITIAQLGDLKIARKKVENAVIICFLALAGINLFMMINPFGFGRILSEWYTPKPDVILSNYMEIGAFRLCGTTMNPNNNAILFGLFLIYFLHLNAKKYWKYIILAFVFVFLTQSRTVMLLTLLIFGLYILRHNSRKVNLILIPSVILSLTAGLFLFKSVNLVSVFNGSAFESNSWLQRMDHYGLLFDGGITDVLLGHGIVLNPVEQVGFYFDAEYLSLGYQYGLIGLLIWLLCLTCIFILSRKANQKSTFGLAIVLFVLGIATTNFTFLNVECATLMMTLVGAWLFLQGDEEFHHHSKEESN